MTPKRTIILFIITAMTMILFTDISGKQKREIQNKHITLFLSGDVMIGRGIDQIMPYSVDPKLYEPYVKDAKQYVQLAEMENGNIETPVSHSYVWGNAYEIFESIQPDFRMINLETSITNSKTPWPGKSIHYKMHPKNIKILTEADIDFCSLANNHTLDWSLEGLTETIEVLEMNHIAFAGAGKNIENAISPSVLKKDNKRVVVLAYGMESSGIPDAWAAIGERAGLNLLPDLGNEEIATISAQVDKIKHKDDVVVFSIHWGGNWGYNIPERQKNFARKLIDNTGVDVVHGHSSHHPKGIEVYKNKLIIYGAGDLINDYEGIGGHEEYRSELSLMYFPEINQQNGELVSMKMKPVKMEKMRLNMLTTNELEWMREMLNTQCNNLGTSVELDDKGCFSLSWNNKP